MNLVRGYGAGLALAALVWMCLFVSTAAADGIVFRRATAVVPMVDQEAVICFKEGVEVLAIRTRADPGSAKAEPLAWVVPVPGPDAPDLLTTTEGTFDTARMLTQPRLYQHAGGSVGWFLLMVSGVFFVMVAALRNNPRAGPVKRVLTSAFLGVAGFLLLAVLLLPTLGTSRSTATTGAAMDEVEVLKQQRVGTLDVTVVRTLPGDPSGNALAAWLKDAGCGVPAEAQPVIADYVAKGWVFVAARLASSESGDRFEPTPLVVRFKAAEPVYPMRLTGLGNGPLELELSVLAGGTAEVDGMRIARSSPLSSDDADAHLGEVPLLHKGLKALADQAGGDGLKWITRLSGRLTPAQQRVDLGVHIRQGSAFGEWLYTPQGARELGGNWGAGLAALGIVAVSVLICARRYSDRRVIGAIAACGAAGLLAGVAVAASVPRFNGPIRLGRPSRAVDRLASSLMIERAADLAAVRALIAEKRKSDENQYKYLPAEGDSPWGYTLRTDEKGSAWIDVYGEFGQLERSEQLLHVSSMRK